MNNIPLSLQHLWWQLEAFSSLDVEISHLFLAGKNYGQLLWFYREYFLRFKGWYCRFSWSHLSIILRITRRQMQLMIINPNIGKCKYSPIESWSRKQLLAPTFGSLMTWNIFMSRMMRPTRNSPPQPQPPAVYDKILLPSSGDILLGDLTVAFFTPVSIWSFS